MGSHRISFTVLILTLSWLLGAQGVKHEFNENYLLEWEVKGNDSVVFQATVRTLGYIGFGISLNGGMDNADIVTMGVHPNGTAYLQDRHGIGKTYPPEDKQQDYNLISAYENNTHTYVKFSRLINTCDKYDQTITADTQKIIWSFGSTDDINYHGVSRGSFAVNILDPEPSQSDYSKFNVWTVKTNVTLFEDDTIYWCTFHRGLKLNKKHHIIGFNIYLDGLISKQHTHHADLYKCTAPRGEDPVEYFEKYIGAGYDCYFSKYSFPVEDCQLFEFQWSIGGKETMFPEYVGVPVGEDPDEYYMTEIHFDNPRKLVGVNVSAGMQFYYTDQLRKYDAGFLQVGVMTIQTYAVTIPPNSVNFIINSHCPSECTAALPAEGINTFIYLLHSHLSGRKMKVRHYRNGEELPWLAIDEHYDFNYQNNRPLEKEVKILPLDHLTLECTYDTTWKKGLTTLGGRSARDEMCQTFLMYYPRILPVNQCGSYFRREEMLAYMGITNVTLEKGKIDPTVWAPKSMEGKLYSKVIQGMNWTRERRKEFQKMTRFNAHQAYCFPLHYDNKTFVLTTYPSVPESKLYTPPTATCSSPSLYSYMNSTTNDNAPNSASSFDLVFVEWGAGGIILSLLVFQKMLSFINISIDIQYY